MTHHPGWVARWQAARGTGHVAGGVTVGYRSGFERLNLSTKELGHHGLVLGAPGSGKTTALSQIVQGHERLGPCIVLDGKGSSALREATWAAGGLVWHIGGGLKLDLLDPDPTILAEQLTEAARHEGPSEVYSEAATRAIQWIGNLLRWEGRPPTLEAVEALLEVGALCAALKRYSRQPRVAQWQAELEAASPVELSGMATALMRVTRLIDSAAGPSLGTGSDAIRLEDVVQGRTTLLISLDSWRYPSLARILGGWALLAMRRACLSVPKGASCLMVVDEIGDLGRQARHIKALLTLGREAGVGVIGAAHGPTQLDEAVPGLASMFLQETAWQLIMAQGDPDDADRLSRLFPLVETDDKIRLGKYATGTPTVTRDHLMWLRTGDCAYRVRPVDSMDGRWGCARVAMPRRIDLPVRLALPAPAEKAGPEIAGTYEGATETEATETVVPTTEEEKKALVYGGIVDVGGWRTWVGTVDLKGYPRVWVPVHHRDWKTKQWAGGYEFAYRLLYTWEVGEIPKGRTIDHTCSIKSCMTIGHLEAITGAENTRRRHARERGQLSMGHAGMEPPVRIAA